MNCDGVRMSLSFRLLLDYDQENFLSNNAFDRSNSYTASSILHNFSFFLKHIFMFENLLSSFQMESNGLKVRCRLVLSRKQVEREKNKKFKDENLWRQTISPAGMSFDRTLLFRVGKTPSHLRRWVKEGYKKCF